jgi:hypothetical protein
MDELFQSLLGTKSALNEFVDLLNGVYANLGDEYKRIPKEYIPSSEIRQLESDLNFMQSFLGVTAIQMEDYLQSKIDILNVFLHED